MGRQNDGQLVAERENASDGVLRMGDRYRHTQVSMINRAAVSGDSGALLRALKSKTWWHDSCWIWTGPSARNGSPSGTILNRTVRPQRVVLELEGYRLTKTDRIVVKCGQKLCINPDHLRILRDI